MKKQIMLDNEDLDYPQISKSFINSTIEQLKSYIEDDFKYPICWFINKNSTISNAVILDHPPKVQFRFLSLLKQELKKQKAVAYIIVKKSTVTDRILRTEEENRALPKTINNNYTLHSHEQYSCIVKEAIILNFASTIEKMKITIPYTREYERVVLENFKEEPAKGGMIFNLLK